MWLPFDDTILTISLIVIEFNPSLISRFTPILANSFTLYVLLHLYRLYRHGIWWVVKKMFVIR